jgi:hypothetical protein
VRRAGLPSILLDRGHGQEGLLTSLSGTTPDNIESNITSVGVHTSSAAEELTTAHEYQRKAGRRKLWLMIILIIVVAVVLLAVRLRLLAAPTFTVTNVARAFPPDPLMISRAPAVA